jgi:peptidyl-prolyl cis-trans isomerase D
MQFFRRLKGSKIGGILGLAFLAMMAFAFVAGDMTGTGGVNVLGPSDAQIAKIGNQSLTANEVQVRTQRFFERSREQQPGLTIDQFLASGGLSSAVDEMIALKALVAYGERHGMRVSKKLVDAEIARTPAFQDATGVFSDSQFRMVLNQQRISEKEVRDDFTGQIIRQHLLMPAAAGARTPESMVPPYAAMLIERREGEMFAIPSQNFAPTRGATEAELKAYYSANPQAFSIPEQRKLRYALISRERFDAEANPTEEEIAAAYKAKAADYAARTSRDFSQLILQTEAQAKDIAAKATGGKTLVDLAREAGLSARRIEGVDEKGMAAQTSAEIAKAGFAATKGQLIGPFRSPLGWALVHVDELRTNPGKTLEQARAELLPLVRAEKARQLFADFVNNIDGKLGEGETIQEVAKAYNLEVIETPLLAADGRNLKDPAYQPDEAVRALLQPAFTMQASDDAQIAQVRADEQIAILAPSDVLAAGPPPLAEVRSAVEMGWRLSQGATKAREAANKVSALINKGVAPEEALKQAGAAGLPRQPLAVRRIELNQSNPTPPPVRALLTMRPNSTKVVEMERNLGFIVVKLDKITPEDPRPNAQLMQSTRAGLANVLGNEYTLQLVGAIQRDLKVTRNAEAIAAVEKALREANGAVAE